MDERCQLAKIRQESMNEKISSMIIATYVADNNVHHSLITEMH